MKKGRQFDFKPTYSKRTAGAALVIIIVLFILLFTLSRNIDEQIPESDRGVIGNFIEWFGVVYGVTLALVVVEVWKNFTMINNEVDREADALVLLLRTVSYLNDPNALKAFASRLREYTDLILQNSKNADEAKQKLDEVHEWIGNTINDEQTPPILASEMIRLINEAIDLRGDRLAHERERIPKAFWSIVIIASILWLICFFGLKIEKVYIAFFICGSATFIVASLLFIIADLNQPSEGFFRISFEPFEVLREELNRVQGKKKHLQQQQNPSPSG